MRSDDIKPRGDVEFRATGIGLAYTQRCGKCSQNIPNSGWRMQMYRGARVKVGVCCQRKAR
jgi:hypothetical protein